MNAAKMQAIQQTQRYAQTGLGRGRSRSSRRSTRKRKASRTKPRAKKRKPSASATRRKPTDQATENISSRHIRLNMNFVHGKLGECVKSELDLFSMPSLCVWKVSLEKGLWINHQPVSSVGDRRPITFLCPGTEDYVDLSKTILVVRAKVTKANGNDLDANEHMGIVNNFLHSLFKQVEVFLKEKQVTPATGTYAYCACLPQLWSCGKRVSIDGRYVLQRYSRQDGRYRSYASSC